jgi:hypothetical protein
MGYCNASAMTTNSRCRYVCVWGEEVLEGLALSSGAVSKVQGRLSED